MSDDLLDKAAHSPIVLWFAIAYLVLSGLSQSVPKVQALLGPVGRWMGTRAERSRRAAVEADDADIAELKRQVKNLEQWKDEQVARNRAHSEWDRRAYSALIEAGIDVDLPPSLI